MQHIKLQIIHWYRRNKRELPWRETNNPYFIWLSEVILQQTRVAQGLDYYQKFIKHYPTICDLANANEQEILADWQGLGYYSRARNLHHAAKEIVANYHGIFPTTYNEIKKLKGIGTYTASAISSFAFNLPHAVVDGNVYRVISRIFNIETPIDSSEGIKIFQKIADELLGDSSPSEHNQAMMEFGALNCTPNQPNCNICPINQYCLSKINNTVHSRPVKKNKIKVKTRYFHYLHIQVESKIILTKRINKDIWQELYQFPLIEKMLPISDQEMKNELFQKYSSTNFIKTKKTTHILSHQKLITTFWKSEDLFVKEQILTENENNSVLLTELHQFPIPRLIERYLEEI
jgi:A/G-specific adenine glycosylase